MRRKKRPYLLLEVLIAFSILLACFVPLVRSPLRLLKLQVASAEKSEIARMEPIYFAEAKAALYKNEVPWDLISNNRQKPLVPYSQTTDTNAIEVYGMQPRDRTEKQTSRTFHKKVYFWKIHDAKSKEGEELLLVNVRLQFEPVTGKKTKHTFDHHVFVKKAAKNEKKPS